MRHCPFCLTELPNDPRRCPRDGAYTVTSAEDARARSLLDRRVGSYQVTDTLARGGMGEVYRAVHPTIGRQVAIKVLSEEAFQNPEVVERFFAEARAVNLIRHPNIIEVVDLAHLPDRRPYMIMELVEGESLRARIKRMDTLPLTEIGPVGLPVLGALDAAHNAGIIHRDLKPANVKLSSSSSRAYVKVLDFGVAKLTDPESSGSGPATSTGSVIGTPAYMAPEQAAGRVRQIDPRSDLYSAGVILYVMVTGRVPFKADAPGDLLMMIMNDPAPAPRTFRPDLPAGVEAVILKALAKDRNDRWQTARDMAGALRRALQEAGLPTRDTTDTLAGIMAAEREAGTIPDDSAGAALTQHVQAAVARSVHSDPGMTDPGMTDPGMTDPETLPSAQRAAMQAGTLKAPTLIDEHAPAFEPEAETSQSTVTASAAEKLTPVPPPSAPGPGSTSLPVVLERSLCLRRFSAARGRWAYHLSLQRRRPPRVP